MKLSSLLLLFIFLLSANVFSGDEILKLPKSREKVLRDYFKVQKKFFKKSCHPHFEKKYYKLLRDYRGHGFYLPEIDGKVDIETINKFIPLLRMKRRWASQMEKKLKRMKNWPYYKALTQNLRDVVKTLLEVKKQHFLAITQQRKEELKLISSKQVVLFKKYFDLLLKQIPFFLGFQHPVDHLLNRKNYADLKDSDVIENKKIANEVFFLRKILEDGALDDNHTKPDKFMRSTLDTLTLRIPKMYDFIDETIRYDLDYILRKIKKQLKRGRRAHIKRFKSWENRVLKTLLFYKKIVQNDKLAVAANTNTNANAKLIRKKLQANKTLREFIYKNQSDTYLFWRNQSQRNKALFVTETILFNEVGAIDGPDALERIDVAKVVRNRVF
ncbi:hypothetical protein N9B72_01975, partial [Bacteriovoracaceae bacterium]|nr:hypothetical protein [Bacteriovoracaceae bacterium]